MRTELRSLSGLSRKRLTAATSSSRFRLKLFIHLPTSFNFVWDALESYEVR